MKSEYIYLTSTMCDNAGGRACVSTLRSLKIKASLNKTMHVKRSFLTLTHFAVISYSSCRGNEWPNRSIL